MRRNKLAIYVHLVWATWDRLPLITPDIKRRLYRCIEGEARDKGCTVLALNGTEEHVHLVISLPTTVTIAELVKQVKGVSSHLANAGTAHRAQFKWQGYYGAFTISRWDLDRIVRYVQRQSEHHARGDLQPEWEVTFIEFERTSDQAQNVHSFSASN